MEKIAVSKIVEFRTKKTKGSQSNFINNIKYPKPKTSDEGGDYWTISISAISKNFKDDNRGIITDKIDEVNEKRAVATAKISKDMYQRNIDILINSLEFDLSNLKPNADLNYISRNQNVIKINGLPVQVKPQHIFTFKEQNVEKVGAVWFVSKLNGLKLEEIEIFTDSLHRYLVENFSSKYEISAEYCITVDVVSQNSVRYSEIAERETISLLEPTIESIKAFW
ncbi:hypothetical protein [Rufibacter ruber]|uniref:hypothetical protein n=1 Tax=Rufibacter ruber TaxID=1783499 RepID=UPI00082ECA43|nr:hypothetical protein [Rufibacter ruber]